MAQKKIKLKDIPHISIRELAFKIKAVDRLTSNSKNQDAVNNRKPQFALFLGAGASKESGIILASEMTKIFKEEIFNIHCAELKTDEEKEDWLRNQKDWYQDGKKEYGCLFEKFADTRTERQRFIENVCDVNPQTGKKVEPSFGYVVLADLMLRNYISTVVTTNFDDLIYIACTTFTGNRPIVYAYGILASEMKMLSPHSKVLKLHGDYLYSNIVNTADEMLAQSKAIKERDRDSREIISNLNMERQVRTVLDNFGLIVIGYAGGDETIMNLLKEVSRDNGFYWCYIKDYPPDEDVLELVQSKNGKLVEISGFDDLMKEISDITNFSIDDLLASFEKRRGNLIERIAEFNNSYIRKSLNEYADELTEKQKDKPSESLSAVEYRVLADKAYYALDYALAEKNYRKAIELNPNSAASYNNLAFMLGKQNKIDEAIENFQTSMKLNAKLVSPYISLAGIYKRLGKEKESKKYIEEAVKITKPDDYFNLAALNSILENKEQALEYLKLAVGINSKYKFIAKTDPDLNWIRDDERFLEIVSGDE